MDHQHSAGQGSSSPGSQREPRNRRWDDDSDSPSLGPETSACPPKRHKSWGPDDNGNGATTSRAVALPVEGDEASDKGLAADPDGAEEDSAEESDEEQVKLIDMSKLRRGIEEFVGLTLDYQPPCTAAEGTTCQIVTQLTAWNSFLRLLCWQLQEISGTSGKLSLVLFHEPTVTQCPLEELHGVTLLLCWLFRAHRCISEVELGNFLFDEHHELLSAALRGSQFVTSVSLRCRDWMSDRHLVSAILSLPHLQELKCSGDMEQTATLVEMLPTFLQTRTSMTTLRLTLQRTEGLSSERIFRALGQNSSLKELVLPGGIIAEAPPTIRAVFTEYLKNTTSLTSLTVAKSLGHGIPLPCILEGLLVNRSIAAVDLACSGGDLAGIQLISEIFEQNNALRSFNLTSKAGFHVASVQGHSAEAVRDRCLRALIESDTLEQVTLPFEVFDEDQWKELLRALPAKDNLRRVTINVPSRVPCPLLDNLCVALKGTDAEDKVSFDTPFDAEEFDERLMCKSFSSVAVLASYALLNRMPSLGHITELHLTLVSALNPHGELLSALTTSLGGTRTLRTFILSSQEDGLLHTYQEPLMQGLANNTSLRELRVGVDTPEQDWPAFARALADVIKGSKNITRVHFGGIEPCAGEPAFFQRLSPDIADNHTLLSVTVPESADRELESCHFDVWDTTGRNASLLACAADFVRGARRDRHCAQALERVHSHPELVETVARLENVDEAEAATMVRNGLRSMEGMHDFMQLAGVVQEEVLCSERPDGRMQLDDLNEDCWSILRRYLRLGDIRDPTAEAPPQ